MKTRFNLETLVGSLVHTPFSTAHGIRMMRYEDFLAQENLSRTVILQTNNKLILYSFNENRKLI